MTATATVAQRKLENVGNAVLNKTHALLDHAAACLPADDFEFVLNQLTLELFDRYQQLHD